MDAIMLTKACSGGTVLSLMSLRMPANDSRMGPGMRVISFRLQLSMPVEVLLENLLAALRTSCAVYLIPVLCSSRASLMRSAMAFCTHKTVTASLVFQCTPHAAEWRCKISEGSAMYPSVVWML